MQFKDYYDILGVPPGADADVIKTAYRKLARKFHPDVSKEKNAEDRFKAINEAYEVLHDPKKRAHYDRLRSQGFRPGEEFQPPPGFGAGGGGFEFDFGDLGNGNAGFSDFFESLFGQARGGGPRPRRPRDATARVEIPLETAFAGGRERIAIGSRTLEVKIPAGITSGQQIRLAGQADGGGDLLLEVHFRHHPQFHVKGRDVEVEVEITPWDAALGATAEVPTLGGKVEMKVPAGFRGGKKLRLKGRGLPGTTPGDQYVQFRVVAPTPTDDAQRKAYEELAKSFANR